MNKFEGNVSVHPSMLNGTAGGYILLYQQLDPRDRASRGAIAESQMQRESISNWRDPNRGCQRKVLQCVVGAAAFTP